MMLINGYLQMVKISVFIYSVNTRHGIAGHSFNGSSILIDGGRIKYVIILNILQNYKYLPMIQSKK